MADIGIKISAIDAASGVFKSVASEAGRLQSSIGAVSGVLSSLGVGLSAGAFITFVTNINNGVDALNDLKDATGASIENISALEDVAKRTGSSFDTVSTALIKLNQGLNTAKPGSDTERAIKAIGLSVAELKTLDPAEAFRRIAVSLSGFEDDANKARLTQELFGKSLKEVAPLLKDLADQGQLNATVTTAQAEAAEKLNKQIFNLQKNAIDAGRAITGALVPALSDGVDRFLLAQKHAGGLLETLALYARLDYSKGIQGNLGNVEKQIAALEERAGRITSDSVRKGNDKAIADLRAQAAYLKELRQIKALEDQGDVGDAVSRKYQRKVSLADISGGDGGKAAASAAAKALADQNRELAEQAKLLATLSGVNGDYQEQLTRLQVVRKTQNLSDARYAELVTELIDKQPAVRALYADQEKSAKAWADQSAASAKAVADLSKDYDAYVKTLDSAASAAVKQVQALEDEEAATLIAAQQNISLAQAIEQVTIARLEEAQTKAYANGDQEAGDAIKREIEARKKLATLIGGKEVREANKKAADAAAKEWEKTADKINDLITDSLMRGFENGKTIAENFRDTIENMFKTMVLRPVVQAAVEPFAQGITGALGLGSGQSKGTGMADAVNTASNLNSLFGTVSQAVTGASVGASTASLVGANIVGAAGGDALGALIAGNGGWAGVSVAAEAGAAAGAASGAAAAGTATAAAGAGSGAAAAAGLGPVGWAALAAVALFSIFGEKNWETKYGGSFDNTGTDSFGTHKISGPGTGGEFGNQYAQTALKATEIGINATLTKLGSSARVGYFSAGAESSDQAEGFANAGGKLTTGAAFGQSSQSGGWMNRRGDMTKEQAIAAYVEELNQATLQALQAATDLPQIMAQKLRGVNIDQLTGDSLKTFTAEVQQIITDAETLQVALAAMPFKNLAGLSYTASMGLMSAAGGLEAITKSAASYYDNFYSAEEKRVQTLKNIAEQLRQAGSSVTAEQLGRTTRAQFRAAAEALDLNTVQGQKIYATMMSVASAFAGVTSAASDASAGVGGLVEKLSSLASSALDGLMKSVAAEKSALTNAYDVQVSSFSTQLSSVNASVSKLQTLANGLKGTLDGMRISGSDASYRADAQAQIRAALATARSGGGLPLDGQLTSALQTVSKPSEALYSTFADYARDFYKTANDIAALGDLTGAQLTAGEEMQALLQDQLDLAKNAYETQVKGLDEMSALAQSQLDAANGTLTAMLSLSDAIKASTAATQALMNERASQGLATGAVVGGSLQSVKPDTARLESINKYINTLDFSEAGTASSVQQLYAAAQQYGVNQAELAAASGYRLEDVQKLFAKHGIPAFAVGTNYVPHDMLAQIHEGEAIVPKAYNPAAGGQGGNDNSAMLAEMRALRVEVAALRASAADTADSTRTTAKTLVRVTENGEGMRIAEGTEIPVTVLA